MHHKMEEKIELKIGFTIKVTKIGSHINVIYYDVLSGIVIFSLNYPLGIFLRLPFALTDRHDPLTHLMLAKKYALVLLPLLLESHNYVRV